jgi:branched-chain amino acid transport system ATP-binding protein
MSPILELDGIHAFYGKAHVLHGVSLEVGRGELVALLGRNGVGKTTVVNSILGLATLKEGSVRINDTELPRPIPHYLAARAGVGIVLQGRRILTNLTVEENLRLGAATGRRGPWNLERVYELFPILRERAAQSSAAMSGGQQQMLAIGRALMANPELLILDEPSEGLAPIIVDEIGELFSVIAAKGMALLLIEQNLGLVRKLANRIYVMSKGAIVRELVDRDYDVETLHEHIAM